MKEIEDLMYKMMHCNHCFLREESFSLREIIQGEAKRICPDCGSLLWLKISIKGKIEEIKNISLFILYKKYLEALSNF